MNDGIRYSGSVLTSSEARGSRGVASGNGSEQRQCCLYGRLPWGSSTSHLSPVTLYKKGLAGQALDLPAAPYPAPNCLVLKWGLQARRWGKPGMKLEPEQGLVIG